MCAETCSGSILSAPAGCSFRFSCESCTMEQGALTYPFLVERGAEGAQRFTPAASARVAGSVVGQVRR